MINMNICLKTTHQKTSIYILSISEHLEDRNGVKERETRNVDRQVQEELYSHIRNLGLCSEQTFWNILKINPIFKM